MKWAGAVVLGWTLLNCSLTVAAQQTLAHLDHEVAPDMPRASASLHETPPPRTYSSPVAKLEGTPLSRSAARALFMRSDLTAAQAFADKALRKHPNDLEALFISMEVAAFRANTPAMLENALALCEHGGAQSQDARVELAAVRVRETAGNTPAFRQAVPRIQHLLANLRQPWPELSEALLRASMDGAPGLEPYSLARSSGILTDWRIVGPLNRRALAGAEPDAVSRNDSLSQPMVQGRAVENFQFPDGKILLPDYLARRGTFYAATRFATLEPGAQILRVSARTALDVYVDGTLSLHALGGRSESQHEVSLDLPAGPHRVLVRFEGGAAEFRLQVTPQSPAVAEPAQRAMLVAEATYLQEQLHSVGRYTEQPPSYCSTVLSAMKAQSATRPWEPGTTTAQLLDGCAPESLSFAEVLSADGKHIQSAAALRKIISAAPLNRAARLMLVRELQLAGDDTSAQRAAADWLRIAPNASSYRRMAASEEDNPGSADAVENIPFYMPFRRDFVAGSLNSQQPAGDQLALLNDSVVIARPDGSVSLYVHRAMQASSANGALELQHELPPNNALPVTVRVVAADGSSSAWTSTSELRAGDTLDVEYVVNYLGDGGIARHPELFQHVFGASTSAALQERFVVLLPAADSDRGTVIVTGNAPQMSSRLSGRMLARIWEEDRSTLAEHEDFAVVRVVEQENGWSTPRSAEKRRKIETARPGPRFLDAALLPADPMGNSSSGN